MGCCDKCASLECVQLYTEELLTLEEERKV
jgi:hypothetical protein